MQRRVSAAQRFRTAVEDERPLQIVGTVNAACALLAQQQGFRAIYLSGAGVANASYGLPDLGLTSLDNVLQDVRRIEALAANASFEETAYLLLYGRLPDQRALDSFRSRQQAARDLPPELCLVLEQLPATAHPMDVLRTGCSALGCLEPESPQTQASDIAERLLATLPGMLCYWHHFHRHQRRIPTASDATSIASHFLSLLHQREPDPEFSHALDVSLTSQRRSWPSK